MKKILPVFLLICSPNLLKAQTITGYTADKLIKRASAKDTLFIINFWATWCAPCVKELPEFDKLEMRYANKAVKIILCSLDFKEDYQQKLPLFIQKKKTLSEVVWFNETDANNFIPKIDNEWLGSIPATLILHQATGFHKFIEGTITGNEIGEIIDRQLVSK